MILTASQLLTEWKLRQGLLPLRSDATVSRTDGYDLDELLMRQAREWYVRCLYELPPSYLPEEDISSMLTLTRIPDGAGRVILPERVARVTSVYMPGWRREARVVSPDTVEARTQLSPYSRGNSNMPVVVVDGRVMNIYTPPRGAADVGVVMAVMLPENDLYPVTQQMVVTMPSAV